MPIHQRRGTHQVHRGSPKERQSQKGSCEARLQEGAGTAEGCQGFSKAHRYVGTEEEAVDL